MEDGYPLKRASDENLTDGRWFVVSDVLYYKPASFRLHLNISWRRCFGNMLSLDNVSNVNISLLYHTTIQVGIHLQNVQNMTVQQCIVRGCSYNGIPIRSRSSAAGDDCSNITIRGCDISWNANGIYLIAEGEAREFNVNVIGIY